jgi:deoxyadenosine/deoxycytidine kinase
MSFKPWASNQHVHVHYYKKLANQLGPFEKPKILIVLGATWPRLMSRLDSYE